MPYLLSFSLLRGFWFTIFSSVLSSSAEQSPLRCPVVIMATSAAFEREVQK